MHETVDLEKCCSEMIELFDNHEYAPLAGFLCATEALQMVHHSHHWQTLGETFYADHQLFQKLYESVQADIDTLGEKLIGLSKEPKLTNYFARMKGMQKFLDLVTTSESYTKVSFRAVKLYVKAGEMVMKSLEEAGLLSPGLEQTLGTILEKTEEHVYLLQQRISG